MASKINPLKTDEETLNNKEIKENHLQDIIFIAGCWEHARRKFFEAIPAEK